MAGKCFLCGVPTPLALRRPGLLSSIPEGKRGYLPYCQAHEKAAFARRARATGEASGDTQGGQHATGDGEAVSGPAHEPEQVRLI